MAMYTKKQFMEYYKFKDEPEMLPNLFIHHYKAYEDLCTQVKRDVEIGVKVKDAIRLNAGVGRLSVDKWFAAFITELEDGKTDTPLIRLFTPAIQSDAKLYRKVMKAMDKKIEEGDSSSIQFMAKHRLGYNSARKQEVELSAKDEAPVKFVFTDMTPTDNENKEEDG